MARIGSIFTVVITIAVGLVVLLGFFVEIPVLTNIRILFLRWAVILAAVALVVGVANLFYVHWRKITGRQTGAIYSTLVIVSLAATVLVVGFFGPSNPWSLWVFTYLQVPAETSLMAVLAVVLVYAGARMLRSRLNVFTVVFLLTVLLVLVGTAALPGATTSAFNATRAWIERIPAAAGARGILLGVALGTVATGLRVLMGADRPYGGG